MSNFMTMYKAEIKKIISKKAMWIALVIGIGFILLMGFTNLSASGHISYVKESGDVLNKISGSYIDDDFLTTFQNEIKEEIGSKPEIYEKMMDFDQGTAVMNAADAIEKKALFDFMYNVVREKSRVLDVTSEEFYNKNRDNIVYDALELGANENEIDEWLKEYDSIEKPIKYYYAESYSNILDVWFFIGWILFLNIAVALAGVFADEKTFRTDAIVLATKKGRLSVCLAKISAGITVALLQGTVIIGTLFGTMFVIFGTEGSSGMIQNIVPSSPWNITINQMVGLFILLAFTTTVLFALSNMFMSQLTHSSLLTMAFHAAVLFIGLFNVPKSFGIIAKLWQLRPTMALYYGTFCNEYRYLKMNNVEASVVIYGICIVLFVSLIMVLYKKSQVESR